MTTNHEIYLMIRTVWNLSTLHKQLIMAQPLVGNIEFEVKGENGIIDTLGAIQLGIQRFAQKHVELQSIPEDILIWITYLKKEYDENTFGLHTKPLTITRKDANKLADDIFDIFEKLHKVYNKSNTVLIHQKKLGEEIVSLGTKLDHREAMDLLDAYSCLLNNIPTSAVMMLYRISESVVKKLYVKELGKDPPENSTMGSMCYDLRKKQELEVKQKKRKKVDSLINYIIVQTEERNLVQHPEKRYDQTEAEEVFIFVKKLINDIDEKMKK